MAIIKCKMCGGDLNVEEGATVCECEYCGTRQTVPQVDDEKKLTLFNRASRLLRNCEFDKATGVFESIVAEFPEEAEAYWGLVLCKYGIEYVDDPNTGKKIPTCHRSSFDSVEDDANFEQACENTDAVARRVYRDEARHIEELRQAILEISGKEEPYDVFISYKDRDENNERTLDSVIAQDIYKELTNEGYRVFFSRISLEGKLGVEYEPYIFAALNSAKVMIVVGTDYENFDAVWVKNEWSRFLKLSASGQKKILIPVYRDMDAYDMPKEFRKLSAQDMSKVGAMQDLVRGVEKLLGKKYDETQKTIKETPVINQSGGPNVTALLDRGSMALEDGEWEQATKYYDQVLNMDSRCAEAYLGLAMAEAHCENIASFEESYKSNYAALQNNKHLVRAKKFANPKLAEWFSRLDKEIEDLRIAEEARIAKLKKEKEANQAKSKSWVPVKRQFDEATKAEYLQVTKQVNVASSIEQFQDLKKKLLAYKEMGFDDVYFYIRQCEKSIAEIEAKEREKARIEKEKDKCGDVVFKEQINQGTENKEPKKTDLNRIFANQEMESDRKKKAADSIRKANTICETISPEEYRKAMLAFEGTQASQDEYQNEKNNTSDKGIEEKKATDLKRYYELVDSINKQKQIISHNNSWFGSAAKIRKQAQEELHILENQMKKEFPSGRP